MNLHGKTVWQIGAGDTERRYGDLCLRHDVMIMGPGSPGRYTPERYAQSGDIQFSLRRFCREAAEGDIVVLRLGTCSVLAVGEIADAEPAWSEAFGDVDGWDLQHVRRVRWFSNTQRKFATETLGRRVRTFTRTSAPDIRSWMESLDIAASEFERPLAEMPDVPQPLQIEGLAPLLFIEGLPSTYIDNLTTVLQSITRIAEWYWNEQKMPKGRPSESETVTYMVTPVLFSLGWSHQTAAIEWQNVDVALFDRMPPDDSSLSCVVEAKPLKSSVFSPAGQARNYAAREGRENCKRLVVTDGIRYALFRRKRSAEFDLQAYWNILRMVRSNPLYRCGGAVEAIIGMAK